MQKEAHLEQNGELKWKTNFNGQELWESLIDSMRSHPLVTTPKMGSLTTECRYLLEMSKFAKNQMQDRGKEKLKLNKTRQAWNQWDKRRVVLVGKYNEATQEAQRLDTDY